MTNYFNPITVHFSPIITHYGPMLSDPAHFLYEIHLTVDGSSGLEVDRFKTVCELAGVKPLLIDMHDKCGDTIFSDLQTSSTITASLKDVMDEIDRQSLIFDGFGFKIVRSKLETTPKNTALVPSQNNTNKFTPTGYFEGHVQFATFVANLPFITEYMHIRYPDVHISRNAFKKGLDETRIFTATYRSNELRLEDFELQMNQIEHTIAVNLQLDIAKYIIEYVVHDSKRSHDAAWETPNV